MEGTIIAITGAILINIWILVYSINSNLKDILRILELIKNSKPTAISPSIRTIPLEKLEGYTVYDSTKIKEV